MEADNPLSCAPVCSDTTNDRKATNSGPWRFMNKDRSRCTAARGKAPLVQNGRLDPLGLAQDIGPGLHGRAFDDATVRQLMAIA